ncbi:hypothetical protein LCGC14_0953210 [marine sediment metagenome]|uniref:Uncharacterized protein n=1 Tax=marine sediment metagenome TaxID=412755 RepID=A0A0F9NGN0_9ZZZZ
MCGAYGCPGEGFDAMTTLEERRAWMRDGCPVTERKPGMRSSSYDNGPCNRFVLDVWKNGSSPRIWMRADCSGCGSMQVETGMQLDDANRPPFRDLVSDLPVMGVETVMEVLCGWMDVHAGLEAGVAMEVLTREDSGSHWASFGPWVRARANGKVLGHDTTLVCSGFDCVLDKGEG